MGPGITDTIILERANQASALLLTADKDFGDLVFQEGRLVSGGVVLIRLAGLSGARKAEIVSSGFLERGADFPDCFSVVTAGRIRVRSQR